MNLLRSLLCFSNIKFSKVAAGMPIPSVPDCIIERDAQHNKIVNQLLAEPNVKVAVLGMGGIGKTTLACSIARDPKIIDAYPRRLFISFEGSSTPDLAFTSLANVFQIPTAHRSSHAEILSHVLEYLKCEKTLLVIDNFETFWEVSANRRDAENLLGQFASLLNLAIIVTMRGNQRPGNISWMKMDPLKTLSEDGSRDLLSVITHGMHNKSALDEECSKKLLDAVDGIPLAVTLIGFLLRDESETAQSLWHRWLQESTRAISTDSDTDDRLYRLDVSIRLTVFGPRMKNTTRDVLAAISLLPVGLSLEAEWLDRLQTILSSTVNIRDCIRTLRNVALAAPNPTDLQSRIDRLRLLAPVRDFCARNLSLDNQVVRKVADLYHEKVDGFRKFDIKEHYNWFAEEISNIAGVLKHSLAIDYVTDDFGYASAVYTRWLAYIDMPSTDILECAVKACAENPAVKAYCLQTWGYVLQHLEQPTEAREKVEQALSIHRDIQSIEEVAWDLYYLGTIHYSLRQYDTAERYLNEAVDIFTEVEHTGGKAAALGLLSDVLHSQNKLPEAERNAAESLKLSRDVGDRLQEANTLRILGRIYRRQGRCDLALETLTASCDLSKDINQVVGEAYANRDLGYVYGDTGELDKAALHLQEAISLFEKANWHSYGEADEVRTHLNEVEAIISRHHDQA